MLHNFSPVSRDLLVLTASIDATVAYCFPNTAEDCCGCDPHRVPGLRSCAIDLLIRHRQRHPTDRLHTCQSSCVLVLAQGASDNNLMKAGKESWSDYCEPAGEIYHSPAIHANNLQRIYKGRTSRTCRTSKPDWFYPQDLRRLNVPVWQPGFETPVVTPEAQNYPSPFWRHV